jgi:hypothetical protein
MPANLTNAVYPGALANYVGCTLASMFRVHDLPA